MLYVVAFLFGYLSSLRDFRLQTQHFAADRDEQVSKASKALESIESSRLRRANVSYHQSKVEDLMAGLTKLKKENEKSASPHMIVFPCRETDNLLGRDRLRTLRESLAMRRRTLSAAKLLPHSASASTARESQELNLLSNTIARARSGLVQELVEVFNVVEVGGRPPIGGKAGTKGEWTIGDLILPVPGDIRSEFDVIAWIPIVFFKLTIDCYPFSQDIHQII